MFYDYDITIYESQPTVNEIGQNINSYYPTNTIKCDIQPTGEKLLNQTFGNDISGDFIVFCDERLVTGTIVKYEDLYYRVNDIKRWTDYNIHLIGVYDINVD